MNRIFRITVSMALLLMLAGLASFTATSEAAESKGCSVIGSWYGYNPPPNNTLLWMTNVFGSNESFGGNQLQVPSYDPTFGGLFPAGVMTTPLRGVWERVGGNTFALTFIGFSVDNQGQTVGIAKMTGTATLIENCNVEMLDLYLEFYGPTAEPYLDDPLFGLKLPIHYGYRMLVDGPSQDWPPL